jgi:hypothetical protein
MSNQAFIYASFGWFTATIVSAATGVACREAWKQNACSLSFAKRFGAAAFMCTLVTGGAGIVSLKCATRPGFVQQLSSLLSFDQR